MDHFTLYIIHRYRNLPLYTHFLLTLYGREQLHSLSIKSLENILRPIFTERSPLSNSTKFIKYMLRHS